MTAKTFQRGRGRSTFPCSLCGRMTRDTDQGGTDLCMDCFELCSMDNGINDDGRKPTKAELKTAAAHIAHIRAKGGQAAKVIGACGFLFPDEPAEPMDTTFAADPVPTPATTPEPDPTEPGATFIEKDGEWRPFFRGPALALAKQIAAAEVKGKAKFRWTGMDSGIHHEFSK